MEQLESRISKAIWRATAEDWLKLTDTDVVVVGADPSGLTAAKYLANSGLKVVVLERRLSFGGGIGGGGMLLHKIVVDERALPILTEFGVNYDYFSEYGLYVLDSSELMAKLAVGSIDAGAKIIHGVTVEDLIVRENPFRVVGVVVQWSAVPLANLHVDPLFICSKAVVDATGHDAELLKLLEKKNPSVGLKLLGERSAYSELGEAKVVETAGKVVNGLYVAGMAVAALKHIHRMGPIFGSMLLSGKKVAEEIVKEVKLRS